jgi:hypothetical protein
LGGREAPISGGLILGIPCWESMQERDPLWLLIIAILNFSTYIPEERENRQYCMVIVLTRSSFSVVVFSRIVHYFLQPAISWERQRQDDPKTWAPT